MKSSISWLLFWTSILLLLLLKDGEELLLKSQIHAVKTSLSRSLSFNFNSANSLHWDFRACIVGKSVICYCVAHWRQSMRWTRVLRAICGIHHTSIGFWATDPLYSCPDLQKFQRKEPQCKKFISFKEKTKAMMLKYTLHIPCNKMLLIYASIFINSALWNPIQRFKIQFSGFAYFLKTFHK